MNHERTVLTVPEELQGIGYVKHLVELGDE